MRGAFLIILASLSQSALRPTKSGLALQGSQSAAPAIAFQGSLESAHSTTTRALRGKHLLGTTIFVQTCAVEMDFEDLEICRGTVVL